MRNPNAEQLREDYERFGQEPPPSLWPPEFVDGAQSWYNAFWDLNSDRPVGMGEGRIPHSAARAYYGDREDFPAFWSTIRAMDQAYLEHARGDEPQHFTREAFRGAFSSK